MDLGGRKVHVSVPCSFDIRRKFPPISIYRWPYWACNNPFEFLHMSCPFPYIMLQHCHDSHGVCQPAMSHNKVPPVW